VGIEVATRFEAGAVVSGRGRPLVRATVLAAGAEAERRLTGIEPRGSEADEEEMAEMAPRTAARGRAEARRLVAALWPYIQVLGEALVETNHMAGPTAIFLALVSIHGVEDGRRREGLLSAGQAFDLGLPAPVP
jgi:hypothetical protein